MALWGKNRRYCCDLGAIRGREGECTRVRGGAPSNSGPDLAGCDGRQVRLARAGSPERKLSTTFLRLRRSGHPASADSQSSVPPLSRRHLGRRTTGSGTRHWSPLNEAERPEPATGSTELATRTVKGPCQEPTRLPRKPPLTEEGTGFHVRTPQRLYPRVGDCGVGDGGPRVRHRPRGLSLGSRCVGGLRLNSLNWG